MNGRAHEVDGLQVAVDRLTRLIAVGLTKGAKQAEAIELLARADLPNDVIADILDTTAATVRATRSRLNRPGPAKAKVTADAPVGG